MEVTKGFKLRMFAISIYLLMLELPWRYCGIVPTEKYPYSIVLEGPDLYQLFWGYDSEVITFEVHVRSQGYVGFGISPNGAMVNSDMVLGWVCDGQAHLKDCYTGTAREPRDDIHQDWVLLAGYETDTHTVLKFKRLINTCDQQDLPISADTVRIIWCFHPDDPVFEVESDSKFTTPPSGTFPYHGSSRRGTRSLQLLSYSTPDPRLPEDATELVFLNPDVNVPDMDTTYWCQYFKLPSHILSKKHHIVMFEAEIQPGHEKLVHHILLYGCYQPVDPSLHMFGTTCYQQRAPSDVDQCNTILFAWAIGGRPFYFPDHVGYPIGGADDYPRFIRMETHYDNPQRQASYVDRSGLRLWVTPTLRDNDAGILETGLMVSQYHIIPPRSPVFTSQAFCVKECLSEAFADQTEGINLFATFHHTHLSGIAARVRHFRHGLELPEISNDQHYDFNFQETRMMKHEINVQKNDDLLVECTYSTFDNDNVIQGGLSTKEEMCLTYLFYYPKQNLSNCQSIPTPQQSLTVIDAQTTLYQWGPDPRMSSVMIQEPAVYRGMTLLQVAQHLEWTREQRDKFQTAVTSGPIISRCQMGPVQYEAHYQIRDSPNITLALPEQVIMPACSSTLTSSAVLHKTHYFFLETLMMTYILNIAQSADLFR